MTLSIPIVKEGAYYLLLSVDDEWQVLERHQLNNEFAVPTDLVIPQLRHGVPLSGMFIADGDACYYRIDVPSGQNLFVRLDDLDDQSANEIYVRFRSLATRGAYDYRANVSGKADQELLVPAAAPGTWYVPAHGESVPGSGEFTIQTDISGLKVTSVTPSRHGSSASAVLTVSGAGFDATTAVALVDSDGTASPAAEVSVDSYTRLTAAFDLTGVSPGTYTLRVSSPSGGASKLASAFEVLPIGEAKLDTNLIVPNSMGQHAVATIYVEYRNTGNLAMRAPLLVLTATQEDPATHIARQGAWLTTQPVHLVGGFWTSAQPEGFSHSVQILASGDTPGVLQPGESGRVPVYYAGWEQPWIWSTPFIFNLGVLRADDTTLAKWNELKSEMKPSSISTEAWDAIWTSFVGQVGTT